MNEYRTLHIPSPFTCLVEAVVLQEIGRDRSFGQHPSVYSYLWPRLNSKGYNFEHYFDNYQARNLGIQTEFRKHPDRVALVLDIRRFYSSIDQKAVLIAFEDRLRVSRLSDEIRDAANACLHRALEAMPDQVGIPIGPEISHLVADLVLRRLDVELFRNYTTGYFRYVDDIVLVIPPDEVGRATEMVKNLLARINLLVHEDKSDVVEAQDWIAHGPRGHVGIDELSLTALALRAKTFVASKPDRFDSLDQRMREAGFILPLGQLRQKAATPSWRHKIAALSRRGWVVLRGIQTDTEGTLVEYSTRVRDQTLRDFEEQASAPQLQGQIGRKWQIQKLRRNANQLLYFGNDIDLRTVLRITAQYPELHETTCVIKGLLDDDVDPLLDLPGPAIATFGSLASLRKRKPLQLSVEQTDGDNGLECSANLVLYGVAEAPPNLISETSDTDGLYLRFCDGDVASKRELDDFSYLDEIRCLQMVHLQQRPTEIVETRFSDEEQPAFEALQLGSGFGASGAQ